MDKKHILYLTWLGAISIILIMIVQIYWVREAIDIHHKQFDQTVNIALREVAEKIAKHKKTTYQYQNPVKRINDSHYIVQVNTHIDAELLDYYLQSTFDYFNINQDVEYGIYTCGSNEMVYCNYIQKKKPINDSKVDLPKFAGIDFYFSVTFPNYSLVSMHNVPMWIITSIILLISLLFFIYALFIIYRQRNITQVQKDFINNMTHEFKTPISTISVIQQVISDPGIVHNPNRLASYADIIGIETKRLNDLVEKVLNTAKLEKGEFALNLEEMHLHDILTEIVAQSKTRYETESNLTIDTNLEAESDLVTVDLIHFSNVIFNLIDNAVKYGGKPPKISINSQNKGKALVLSVSDNGLGIEKKDHKRIFDKFYRVHTGNVHNVKGFGLGLYYVKRIIDVHRFKILVDSTPSVGTTFIIEIPQL